MSVVALFDVACGAKHLAVIECGLTALRPRDDVVSLHLLDGELFPADGALAVLFSVFDGFLLARERTKAQQPFITRQQVLEHAGLLRDFIVPKQSGDFPIKFSTVKVGSLTMLVVYQIGHRSNAADKGQGRLDDAFLICQLKIPERRVSQQRRNEKKREDGEADPDGYRDEQQDFPIWSFNR